MDKWRFIGSVCHGEVIEVPKVHAEQCNKAKRSRLFVNFFIAIWCFFYLPTTKEVSNLQLRRIICRSNTQAVKAISTLQRETFRELYV